MTNDVLSGCIHKKNAKLIAVLAFSSFFFLLTPHSLDKMKSYTPEQVAEHTTAQDCWIIIDNKVFDVTKFLNDHPGGKKILLKMAGKDATKKFQQFHNDSIMQRVGLPMQIGVIGSQEEKEEPKAPAAAPAPAPAAHSSGGEVSYISTKFGEGIPYGDPTWYQDWNRYGERAKKEVTIRESSNITILLLFFFSSSIALTTMSRISSCAR